METGTYHSLAFVLPLVLLSRSGLAYYHLYQRLEPDPSGRALRSMRRYLGSLILAFSAWAILQTTLGILFEITSPIMPMIAATLLAGLFNQFVMRTPANWRELPPYLSEDRSYHAFLQVVADRAAEVKAAPEKRDAYLKRMYADDQARMIAVGQYLAEHKNQSWIMLKPDQLNYHPDLFRFPITALYLVALLPILVPFLLSFYDPTITEKNIELTVIASALASIFYSPLFDPDMLRIITFLAASIVIALMVSSELRKLRYIAPPMVGLFAMGLLLCFITSYVQTYVIDRTDTALMQATEYALDKLGLAARAIGEADRLKWAMELANARNTIELVREVDIWVTWARRAVLDFQSRLGGLFILPALFFWSGLTAAVIWEINFSHAAQITFRSRMRKPQV